SPPYVGLLALLSTVLFGKPWLAVALILVGCVPLAGCTAYLAGRTLVPDSQVVSRRGRRIPPAVIRVWLAATYALLPLGMGAPAPVRAGGGAAPAVAGRSGTARAQPDAARPGRPRHPAVVGDGRAGGRGRPRAAAAQPPHRRAGRLDAGTVRLRRRDPGEPA